MSEIINLRLARKRKQRAGKEAQAAANRIAFGRSRAERALSDARNDLAQHRLDGQKRDDATE